MAAPQSAAGGGRSPALAAAAPSPAPAASQSAQVESDDTDADDDDEAPATHEQVTVARGRTVEWEGKHRGPGSILTMPVEDADYLRRAGFLLIPVTDDGEPTGPTINGERLTHVRPK